MINCFFKKNKEELYVQDVNNSNLYIVHSEASYRFDAKLFVCSVKCLPAFDILSLQLQM